MVLTWLPERVKAAHSVPTDQDVLQGIVEGVADVQSPSHIRWWDHDCEALVARAVRACAEGTGLFPHCGEARLGFACVKCLFHRHECLPFLGFSVASPSTQCAGKTQGSKPHAKTRQ